ncbi:hypothetical protein AMTR_s00040p00021220 [Amborella trichopoda]|uniref:Uncharacterized protein n=1 Tax=Amborella trichopoda TaxID=13333 RepID=W1PSF7_AMBTC|nr:hypothetical protein AMTR_s00040p00021220 [Amborella trichopoda]
MDSRKLDAEVDHLICGLRPKFNVSLIELQGWPMQPTPVKILVVNQEPRARQTEAQVGSAQVQDTSSIKVHREGRGRIPILTTSEMETAKPRAGENVQHIPGMEIKLI